MTMSYLDDLWSCAVYCIALTAGLFLFMFYDPEALELSKDQQAYKSRRKMRKSSSEFRITKFLAKLGITYDCTDHFESFCEHFKTFQEVSSACRRAGLEKCNLILGIDFTASNEWQGRKTFNQQNLHKIMGNKLLNPYQRVIWIIGKTLAPFDEDNKIPCFGFGDSVTTDKSVFPFKNDIGPCEGIQEVLTRYTDIASKVTLSGPTSFAPVIQAAIEIVKEDWNFTILAIIADGQVTEEQMTIDAIVEASNYPLSIIVIGVGDGPWDVMEEFDHRLPKRKFDNFRFVDYHKTVSKSKYPDSNFALQTLMEIPDQYKTMQYLGYIKQPQHRKSIASEGRLPSEPDIGKFEIRRKWSNESQV